MPLKVKSFLTLKQTMGNRSNIEVDHGSVTLMELLRILAEDFGSGFTQMVFDKTGDSINPDVRILVNGRHYTTLPEELGTIVGEGDEICLFPPIAGG